MLATENDARKKRLSRKGCLFLMAISFMIIVAFYWQFRYCFPRPWDRAVHVAGVVVDETTKQPTAKARVFITIYNSYGLIGDERFFFGLETNEHGEFSLKQQSQIDVDGIRVEASSPNNYFASISLEENSNQSIVLELRPLPKEMKTQRWSKYDNFSGRYRIPSRTKGNIEFLSDPWEPH